MTNCSHLSTPPLKEEFCRYCNHFWCNIVLWWINPLQLLAFCTKEIISLLGPDKCFTKHDHSWADQTEAQRLLSTVSGKKVWTVNILHKCARTCKQINLVIKAYFMLYNCDPSEQIVLRFAVIVMRRCAMETVSSLTTSCMGWYDEDMIDLLWGNMRWCEVLMKWWCDTMLPERQNHLSASLS